MCQFCSAALLKCCWSFFFFKDKHEKEKCCFPKKKKDVHIVLLSYPCLWASIFLLYFSSGDITQWFQRLFYSVLLSYECWMFHLFLTFFLYFFFLFCFGFSQLLKAELCSKLLYLILRINNLLPHRWATPENHRSGFHQLLKIFSPRVFFFFLSEGETCSC